MNGISRAKSTKRVLYVRHSLGMKEQDGTLISTEIFIRTLLQAALSVDECTDRNPVGKVTWLNVSTEGRR